MKKTTLSIALSLLSFVALSQSQGPNIPNTVNNTSCPFSYSSTLDYSPTNYVQVSDDFYAIAVHCDCCDANTRCLESTDFGFAIPANATIKGIVVGVEKNASGGSTIQDNGVRIIKNGSTTGVDHMNSANWGYTDFWSTYGNATDLWGATWTPADINATNFGVAFAAISYTCFSNGKAAVSSIDAVQITVYYSTTTGITLSQSSGGAKSLEIYPNPSSGAVTLKVPADSKTCSVECFDITGKKLISVEKNMNNGTVLLNETASLSKGIYFVQVKSGEKMLVGKLVIE